MAYTTINKSTDYFNTKLYTGTGSSNAITGVGFQPDFVWQKSRSNAEGHGLFDVLRGVTNRIQSNTNSATSSQAGSLTAFGSDGFTVGGSPNNDAANGNGQTFASWNWKAGTTSGISPGSQNITPSSYSINTTAGFGIYKWSRTGASTTDFFSHGLGTTPTIAIQKRTDGVQDWYVNYTFVDGSNDNLHLNKTDAKEDDSTTVPTSTNYYPKSPETGDYITYLFRPVRGFSKFSYFTGNGNVDGPFLHCGFKPAFVIIKNTVDGAKNWEMLDNKRPGHNPADDLLFPDTVDAESASQTDRRVDFTSTGIKIRGNSAQMNASGQTMIFMAFAAAPFVNSSGIPVTAGV